jgi:hypothetical protein
MMRKYEASGVIGYGEFPDARISRKYFAINEQEAYETATRHMDVEKLEEIMEDVE